MKFSFHTCGLERVTFEEAIEELADIGYAACGPIVGPGCHLDPGTVADSQIASFKNLAGECGIAFSILNPWKTGGFAAGVERGETEAFYRSALDLAADLGASGVKFLPGSPGDIVDWMAVMKALDETGYAGWVELVHYPWFPPDFHRQVFSWATELASKTGKGMQHDQ